MLHDTAITGVAVVTTPEEMPVTETLALLERLERETGVQPTTLIANRVLPASVRRIANPMSSTGSARRCRCSSTRSGAAAEPCSRRPGSPTPDAEIGEGHLDRLRAESDLPMLIVPELFTRATGRRVVTLVADALGRGARLVERRRRRATDRVDLQALMAAKEMVLVCGSGGVGKTTTAAAMAVSAVTEIGGRVLVLTVDPARRLADALGVGQIGNEATLVPDSAFTDAGVEPRGELWAAMLDTKAGWDDLIRLPCPRRRSCARPCWRTRLPEHHQSIRAQSRLPGDGAAARAALVGRVRPDHRRHTSVAERPRHPRLARVG